MNQPVVVFEDGGAVHLFCSEQEAAGSIEAWDLEDGHYEAAFCADGESLEMTPAPDGIFVEFSHTGINQVGELSRLLVERGKLSESEDPYRWAIARCRAGRPTVV